MNSFNLLLSNWKPHDMGHVELIVSLVSDVPKHKKTIPNYIVCMF